VPTGGYKTRSNDTEYRFRPATEFAHLVGSAEPDAVLVVEADGSSVLYQAPVMDRSTPAFFTDRVYGELWVGPRPSLEATSALLGVADPAARGAGQAVRRRPGGPRLRRARRGPVRDGRGRPTPS
jgi:Xaa-Pro aminopeptidase